MATILRRSAFVVVALVLVAVLVATVTITVAIRRPLPQYAGTVKLSGLSAHVMAYRDARGVPHIVANDVLDLFRAQGYVQAQDQFFQMDMRRHIDSGRLSELVGTDNAALNSDTVARTLGWRDSAQHEWTLLSPRIKTYMEAFAAGVNDYIGPRSPGRIAIGYTALSQKVDVPKVEPWSAIDSLTWLKAFAWDVRSNYQQEIDRTLDLAKLGDISRVNELFPSYDPCLNPPILQTASTACSGSTAQTTTRDAAASSSASVTDSNVPAGKARISGTSRSQGRALVATEELDPGEGVEPSTWSDGALAALRLADTTLNAAPGMTGDALGSNAVVVSGRYTDSGGPLVAADPHLSLDTTSPWYQVGLHCSTVSDACPFDVSGFTFPGVPGVMVGHNADVGWALASLGADVTDLFVERIRQDTYQYGQQWLPIEQHTETITIAGAQPETIVIRQTQHGPIVSGVLGDLEAAGDIHFGDAEWPGSYAVALGWTGSSPGRTAEAIFALDEAATPADITAAGAMLDAPAQSIVFGTVDGHIGYQAAGQVPIRQAVEGALPADGSWPRPGWLPEYTWQGFVPSDQLPAVLDPVDGYVVAANQQVQTGGPFLTGDWDYGYRASRIGGLVSAQIVNGPVTVDTLQSIQMDTANPCATILVPYLLDLGEEMAAAPEATFLNEAVAMFRDWQGGQDADSSAAAYFAAVWDQLLQLTFWDELPVAARPDGGSRWLAVITQLLADETNPFWDDLSTPSVVETRDEVLYQSLQSARRTLTSELGKDPTTWRWGDVHTLAPRYPVVGADGESSFVRALVNPRTVQLSGGTSIVNATAWDAAADSFEVTAGPSMRMVMDLGDLDGSVWVNLNGNSGHPGSPHYTDQLSAWARGRYFPWSFGEDAIRENAVDVLNLEAD